MNKILKWAVPLCHYCYEHGRNVIYTEKLFYSAKDYSLLLNSTHFVYYYCHFIANLFKSKESFKEMLSLLNIN